MTVFCYLYLLSKIKFLLLLLLPLAATRDLFNLWPLTCVYRVICRRLARHGSLHTFLHHHDDVTQGRCDVICRLLADVARALDFIHSRQLVHNNVTSHAVYVIGPHTVIYQIRTVCMYRKTSNQCRVSYKRWSLEATQSCLSTRHT